MSWVTYSLALCKPTNKYTTISSASCSSSLVVKNHSDSSSLVVKNHSEPQERVTWLQIASDIKHQRLRLAVGRREALLATGVLLLGVGGAEPDLAAAAAAAEDESCEFTIAPNGLGFCDKLVGVGPQPTQGQLIKAHYIGRLEDGKVFDSSYNRGKPLAFRVGVGEVIKGWDQGILGTEGIPPMLAGGKRRLKIPPELGYGVRGAGCRGGSCIIPPNSVLLFDVEFIGKA